VFDEKLRYRLDYGKEEREISIPIEGKKKKNLPREGGDVPSFWDFLKINW